jgi:hypothetical protein
VVTATGRGQSKQQGRQQACAEMLELLLQVGGAHACAHVWRMCSCGSCAAHMHGDAAAGRARLHVCACSARHIRTCMHACMCICLDACIGSGMYAPSIG